MDKIVCRVMEHLVGYHIPLENEGLGWEHVVEMPVASLDGYTFPCWVTQLPVKMGGLGLRSQTVLAPVAYVACLEQTIPFFGGEGGICPALSHLVREQEETSGGRWELLLSSGARTGREMREAWQQLQNEARQCYEYLGEEFVGPMAVDVEDAGEGSTDGSTRSLVTKERERLWGKVFKKDTFIYNKTNSIT